MRRPIEQLPEGRRPVGVRHPGGEALLARRFAADVTLERRDVGGDADRAVAVADVEHDVVAELVHLVVEHTVLGAELDPRDRGVLLPEGLEERGGDGQLFVVFHPPRHALREGAPGHRSRRVVRLHRRVEGLEEAGVAHVAEPHCTADLGERDERVEDRPQVRPIGKVLHDRVHHDRVDPFRRDAPDFVRCRARQTDVTQPTFADLGAQFANRHFGDVDTQTVLAEGRDPEHDETGAAADFEEPPRPEREDSCDRAAHPLEHVRLLVREPRATVDPPGRIEAGLAGARPAIALVEYLRPLLDLLGRRPPVVDGRPLVVGQHDVRDEARLSVGRRLDDGNGLLDPALRSQRTLDLSELDAMSADLDLMIEAAQVFELAAGQVARAVPRPVHASAGVERVRYEALRRQGWPIEVAAGEARARDVDLADHAGRDRLHRGVQHEDAGVGDGPTDRGFANRAARDPRVRRVRRVLRRTVEVIHVLDGAGGVEAIHEPARQGLARQVDGANQTRHPARLQQRRYRRRHGVHQDGRRALSDGREVEGVLDQDNRLAEGERKPQFEDREVEADGRGREDRRVLGAELVERPVDERVRGPMRDRDAFRDPCGARRVNDISDLVGVHVDLVARGRRR